MNDIADRVAGLRSLELYYFRIPRERWELMLALTRQMGANAISTVVPWTWHQPQDDLFDLIGITHPTRDLTDFLETCQAMDFQVVLKVRPYYDGAGLLGGGVPGWLLHQHPEVCALAPDSQPRHDPVSGSPFPSAEHPTYLKYVQRWYQQLTNALSSWQAPAGPVVGLRVDNLAPERSKRQTGGITAHWDYNPHVVEVQWPIWLRQQYDGVDALNAAWQTDYQSVSDVPFLGQPGAPDPFPAPDDVDRFVAYATAHANETYAHLLAEMGWTIPIVTDPFTWPKGVELTHVAQVDPDSPQLGVGVRWAMDAPLRPDGHPRYKFWTVKATLLDMDQGVKQFNGGVLVTGPDSRLVRLPRPRGDYRVYRLLIHGQLLDASSRRRGDTLFLDYLASDEAGHTDMYIVLDDPSAPLPDFLRAYLASLLMGRARTLQRAGAICQVLAEALSSETSRTRDEEAWPAIDDLRAAEQGLEEARRAAQRAAASIGRLERLAKQVRGDILLATPATLDLSALSPRDRGRLPHVRNTCTQVAPILGETAQSITTTCQNSEPGEESLTIHTYRSAVKEAQATTEQAETLLAGSVARLRVDLASGALSPSVWPIQDWLSRTLQGLTASWLQ